MHLKCLLEKKVLKGISNQNVVLYFLANTVRTFSCELLPVKESFNYSSCYNSHLLQDSFNKVSTKNADGANDSEDENRAAGLGFAGGRN